MQIIKLYRYNRPDGGITTSPVKPDCDYTEKFRLVADEGMELAKGDIRTTCIDTDDADGWEEVVEGGLSGDEITGDEFLRMVEEVL